MFSINLNTLLAAIAGLIGISGWVAVWRKTMIAEGKHLEEIRAMKDRIAEVEKRSEFLRGSTEEANSELRGLKIDMEWVKAALVEIKELVRRP